MFIGTNTFMILYDDSALNFNIQLRGRLAEVHYSYLGVHGLKYRTGDQFYLVRFVVVFLSPSLRINAGTVPQHPPLPRPLIQDSPMMLL
jgi:hypothetical protein